jgi:hypothetical protein
MAMMKKAIKKMPVKGGNKAMAAMKEKAYASAKKKGGSSASKSYSPGSFGKGRK